MAGTVTASSAYILADGKTRERVYTLACVGDAADGGSVPVATISGMAGWRLTELQTKPGSGGAQPDAYTVAIADSDSGALLTTSARSQTAKEFVGGHESLGYYPKIEGDITVTLTALGNSNTTTVKLKFELGVI